ncbi:bifunctional protein fold [Lactobacillus selangorensis]|uniref:Bifunctional protein FolD n=1 Tax=Lactobacillus selangorensis TaxID=81857 RepID=A0A0R2FND1_9LACO|nr:bifunctional methylenetetrahydrofolate dehydrogenase/methenyltetrahydrofolate cyclohydrolase FolD [Lactobacillus selangorensis]KRN29662.1 bifunctional protein fold [Lactobacillus selangorensis]KRN33809.1 bifunctional protein fold [Lactobacillus selangorensis]
MVKLLDGKKLSQKMNVQMKQDVAALATQGIIPGLAVILVGDDAASHIYVRNKKRRAEKLGIRSVIEELPVTTTETELLQLIDQYNRDPEIDGILVQLPLPAQIDPWHVLLAIDPHKDVDGFSPVNMGKLWSGRPDVIACTPLGIMKLLAANGIDVAGMDALVIGRSTIVGRPMAGLLVNADATVTIAHTKTNDVKAIARRSDLIVAACGVAHFITADDVKPGAVVVDVGMDRLPDGKLTGDVDFEHVKDVASAITPVPGGVGPMTITMLMNQTIQLAKGRAQRE